MELVPPEICDRSLDFLWNDPAALMNCSLTCRLWLPTSRYHLFRARPIKLYNASGYKRLENILHSSSQALTGIARYIHHLDLYAGNSTSITGSEITWLKLVDPDTRLSHLLAGLSSVQRLTLWGCCRIREGSWTHVPADVYDPLFRFITQPVFSSTLTTLCLGATTFACIDDFVRLLSAFPHLSCVDLRRCHVERGPPPPPPSTLAQDTAGDEVELRGELRISVPPSDPWQPLDLPLWLVDPAFALHTTTFRWDGCVTVQAQPLLRDLLQRIAPWLRNLHIDLWLDEDAELVRAALASLDACHNLVVVCIRCRSHAGALAVLSHIRATALEELHLGVELGSPLLWEDVAWDEVDEHVCRVGRENPRVAIYFDTPDRAGDALLAKTIAGLPRHLPRSCHARVRMAARVVRGTGRRTLHEEHRLC